ncbi:unnamed protein product [Protopolystoma xenopodis]|uniref:Uncharacterized protein n=1 Tax=Protopolystoma xenopodis TaxID=117903 RepID=A0A3S5FEU7_9PLAT|nr:unnamed protein product [Protopolystoma xenopodis]
MLADPREAFFNWHAVIRVASFRSCSTTARAFATAIATITNLLFVLFSQYFYYYHNFYLLRYPCPLRWLKRRRRHRYKQYFRGYSHYDSSLLRQFYRS